MIVGSTSIVRTNPSWTRPFFCSGSLMNNGTKERSCIVSAVASLRGSPGVKLTP